MNSDTPTHSSPPSPAQSPASTDLCTVDRYRLEKLRAKIKTRQNTQQPISKMVAEFERKQQVALEHFQSRKASVPVVRFPANLPIADKHDDIATLIQDNPVVILAGETGSGKTTQLPKICLSIGRGVSGMIGHTQPRRIAASTVASRIAEELQVELGGAVGYQVRFTDHSSSNTHIKLMTDGILLAEIQQDPLLLKYDTLIIDEAHERSLNIDFLLGYLKELIKKRDDLKIIVTSATIDLEKFSKHFDNAPIVEVSGRTYPVDVFYRPWQDEFEDVSDAIVHSIGEILDLSKGGDGDILIFLSGEREIRETSHAIKKAGFAHLEVLPLYARLSLAEQNRVFQNHKGRRVVLATNVAETSITVPGVRFVIDPGTARVSRYSVRTKVQRLPVEPVSQASANQRKGRCGRVSEGVCIRLYSEEDFLGRPEYTDAEILRTNLAAVILQMLQLRIGDVRKFPFIDRPENKYINDGFKLLEELQAVDKAGRVTQVGRQLQRIPLDPRLARAIVDASRFGCLKEVLIITSALSLQDPRERPVEKQQAADEKHRRFWDEHSDFVAYINLWDYAEEQRQELSTGQFRKLCKREFINFMRLKEWRDLHHQLRLVCKDLKFTENKEITNYEMLHRALLMGMISNIGQREEDTRKEKGQTPEKSEKGATKPRVSRQYLGTRNKKFQIFPGSSQNKKRPKWMMAAEFIETSQLFSHCVAKIEPEWVLNASSHLVKHHYYEPHYDARSGQVKAFDRITLFGLVLVEKRSVNYSDIDQKVSREVFIRSALVEEGYGKRGKGAFFKKNKALVEEIYTLESKSRRRDILVEDEEIFRFYDERIPEIITNLAGFEHWRETEEKQNPDLLVIDRERLLLRGTGDITAAQFPDFLECDGLTLPLKYHFEPNHPDDGVSIVIPAELLHVIQPNYLEWLVPGLLRDKCIALVKSLPKRIRKNFVPVPLYVDKVLARMKTSNRFLAEALGEALSHIGSIKIEDSDWQDVTLDDFYLMNIQIVDDKGRVVDRSRQLSELRDKYKEQVQTTLKVAGDSIERSEIIEWDFGELATEVYLNKGAIKVKGFPALVDKSSSVSLQIKDNPLEAQYDSYKGCLRLASIAMAHTCKYLNKQLLVGKDLGLAVVDLGKKDDVKDDIILAAISRACFAENGKPVVDQNAFLTCVERGRPNLVAVAQEYETLLAECLMLIVGIKKTLKSSKNMLSMAFAFADINQQLHHLFYPGFLVATPWCWLEQYPRFLRAIEVRLEKAPLNPRKDQMAIDQVDQHWQRHVDHLQKQGHHQYASNSHWQEYRWLIEELRVSLFAQTLKTLTPVSDKRLGKKWREDVLGNL